MPIHAERRADGALQWRISNPARRNAIDPEALEWIAARAAELAGETVVLRGHDDDPFCAGFDLTRLEPRPNELPDAVLARATAAMDAADATFVAAVGGYAIGAGVELLATSDIVVAASDAWLQIPVARVGVVYHAAGLRRVTATFGPALSQRLILLGEKVGIEDAVQAGAIAHAVSPGELETTVTAVVAALGQAADASTRGHRRFLRALRSDGVHGGLLAEHEEARRSAYQVATTAFPPPGPTGDDDDG